MASGPPRAQASGDGQVTSATADGSPRLLPALARSAYGAFVVQGPVLLAALALALRPILLPAEVKDLAVAVTAGSFAFSWLRVARTRLGRIRCGSCPPPTVPAQSRR